MQTNVQKLRKNASLKSVAQAARADADRLIRRVDETREAWKANTWGKGSADLQWKYQEAFREWDQAATLATHLERLAG